MGKIVVPVAKPGDIEAWFKNNSGSYKNVGYFGHGDSSGAYVGDRLIGNGIFKTIAANLSGDGKTFLFSCEVAQAKAAVNYAKQFYKGQSLYASSVIINYSDSGIMRQKALDSERGELWLYPSGGVRDSKK